LANSGISKKHLRAVMTIKLIELRFKGGRRMVTTVIPLLIALTVSDVSKLPLEAGDKWFFASVDSGFQLF